MTKTRDLANLADLNFDSGTMVVDKVNDRVGIGTASPTLLTHLKSSDNTILQLESTTPTVYMKMVDSNTTGAGYIGYVTNDMTFWANNAEAMRVSGGNLLVGKTAIGSNVNGGEIRADGRILSAVSSNYVGYFNRRTNDGSIIQLAKDGSTVGSIGVDGGDNLYLTGQSGNTGGIYMNDSAVSPAYQGVERDNYYNLGKAPARWKDLYLSGGVYLGGTGSANYLDDYEEGSWTPVLREASRATSVTYGAISAQYIKIGTQVTLTFRIPINTHDGATGGALWRIYGFPFTPNSDAGTFTVYNNNSGNLVGYGRLETSTYGAIGIIAIPTTSTLHSTIVYTTNS